MHPHLNAFYLKHIRPADPGFFLTKYAGKAAFSCLVSFFAAILIGLEGEILFWCMAGAVCTVLFRTGSTLKRRKIYALVLLTAICVTVPAAAAVGQHIFWSLGFIFLLAFVCFFIASLGVSAATVGTGCLIVTLISIFSPAGLDQGILRSIYILFGGLISFFTNFYLWPFDPEKVLFSSAKLAIEDMAFFLEGVCIRVKNPSMPDGELSLLSKEAISSVRRYRIFLESFNIDPLKGSGASGVFYFALVKMFESIVGLSNHIHFSDNQPEFRQLREDFHNTAAKISHEFDQFSKLEQKKQGRPGPDFDKINHGIDQLRESLLNMGGYKKDDDIQEKFQEAWAAVYGLKNVMTEFQEMQHLAEEKFPIEEALMSFKTFSKLKSEFKVSSPVFRHAVRAAVAITAAIAAAKNLTLSHAVWIPISVIVVMRPSLGGTLQISWKRFAGTVIGAAAGVLLICLNLSNIMVFMLVPLLFFFIFYFKAKNFIAFTTILTLAVVLILGTVFSHTWQGGMERIFDTFLGIAFGLGASFLIWPNFSRKNLRKEMADLIDSQHGHFKQLRKTYFSHTQETGFLLTGRLRAAQHLESCSEKFKDASIEPGLKAAQRQELLNLTDIFTRIHRHLTALSSIVNKSTGVFHGSARKGFEELMDAVEAQFHTLKLYAEKGEIPTAKKDFPASFNTFMVYLGKLRSQGEFENFTLDRRNNSSAFIRQINRLGTELIRAQDGIKALRKTE